MTLTHHLLLFSAKLMLGLAGAMALTSPRQVTSGFFRVHLWVILGLAVLASLSAYSISAQEPAAIRLVWIAGAAAAIAYIGSVIWLYERYAAGRAALIVTLLLSAALGVLLQISAAATPLLKTLLALDFAASGLLLGAVTTAMLLGHWYLNTPTMELAPLRKLLFLLAIAILLRGAISACGALLAFLETPFGPADWTFLALRWLAGLVAPAILAKMTWETLKIPNTQSATGILYAGVILVFVGELVAQLTAAHWHLPA